MLSIPEYRAEFLNFLSQNHFPKFPKELYEPIIYILNLDGKRLRPILTLMAADAFGDTFKKANYAALAVETFHNFSLVHDDIMDKAPLRRGKHTVYKKWGTNTSILSGDAMLILAYQFFEQYDAPLFKKLAQLFSKTAVEVCEGQRYDIDFETQEEVNLEKYLLMIKYKTAVLLGASLKMGALVSEAADEEAQKIYEFGVNIGLAFQIQDDFLDAFGEASTFGKKIGGDILENKKTFLYISALKQANEHQKNALKKWFSTQTKQEAQKINAVKELYKKCGVIETCKETISQFTHKSFDILNSCQLKEADKLVFIEFGKKLIHRIV